MNLGDQTKVLPLSNEATNGRGDVSDVVVVHPFFRSVPPQPSDCRLLVWRSFRREDWSINKRKD